MFTFKFAYRAKDGTTGTRRRSVAGKPSLYCAVELCTSCTISEILSAQRAHNAGQGNLTEPEKIVMSLIFCGTMAPVSHL
jgi:hypothetical protein